LKTRRIKRGEIGTAEKTLKKGIKTLIMKKKEKI